MPITKQLESAQHAFRLPPNIQKAVDLRRELEKAGMIKPPSPVTIRVGPSKSKVRVLYR